MGYETDAMRRAALHSTLERLMERKLKRRGRRMRRDRQTCTDINMTAAGEMEGRISIQLIDSHVGLGIS